MYVYECIMLIAMQGGHAIARPDGSKDRALGCRVQTSALPMKLPGGAANLRTIRVALYVV